MNELKIFENDEFGNVRVIEKNGEPWFVGKDVAEALGYAKPLNALAMHLENEESLKQGVLDSRGINQETIFINESGLYSLIFRSQLPTARKFKYWVTSEVLPSIRKTGSYKVPQGKELIALALIEADQIINDLKLTNSQLTVQNTIMEPKAAYFDELVDRNLLTNFRDAAKELRIRQKEFVSFLLDKKYIYRDSKGRLKPFKGQEDLFEIKETLNEKTGWVGTQTLITPKGRETFRLLMIQ